MLNPYWNAAGSPTLTRLVEDCAITFVISDQIDDHPVGQCRRLVEDEPPLFNTGLQWAHGGYCTTCRTPLQAVRPP